MVRLMVLWNFLRRGSIVKIELALALPPTARLQVSADMCITYAKIHKAK